MFPIKKVSTRDTLLYLMVMLVMVFTISGLQRLDKGSAPDYSQIRTLFVQEQVKYFSLEGHTLTMKLANGEIVTYQLADPAVFYSDMHELIDDQLASGVLEGYDYPPGVDSAWWYNLLPSLVTLLLGGAFLFFLFRQRSAAGGPGGGAPGASPFGRANTRTLADQGKRVTFDDVAGAEEEKAELQEIVDFLRDPQKFTALGARIPKGVLLVGPPGTGKTLIAKAVAGEAGVQFLSISGSDFVELYVGVGASRVRDLFEQARKVAPAIIFIDEIDAVGRKRGSGLGGGHDEREQTLNQLLVELDGFSGSEGVIVLAATNRPDILDPALLRPGRFDRQIHVGRPDVKGREDILKIHAKGKRLAEDVDLHMVALTTAGFTGADLANLMNEAAIMAARADRPVLTMEDLNDAMMKIIAGPEKRSRVRLQRDLKITAIHEAGHAVAMHSLPTHDPVHQISIIPRGYALGLTWTRPREDTDHLTRNEMYEQIVGLLGGRVAEALFLQDISTGASNDIDRASKLARDMVARYGMCEKLGTVSYTGGDELFIGRDYQTAKSYSEKFAGTIDDEVQVLMDKAYRHCEEILRRDADKMKQVVEFLLKHETMTGDQFHDCMAGREIREAAQKTFFEAQADSGEETTEE